MTTTTNLFGEELVQHDELDEDKTSQISASQLDGKSLAIYFSAHWCSPCRKFTPKLAKAYTDMKNDVKSKLDIIFMSFDKDQEDFNEYFKEMPWKAIPFSDRDRSKALGEKFHVRGLPALIVLSSSLETISNDGIGEVYNAPDEALRKWSEGKSLFWNREPREGEHVWEGINCSECFLNPLIGSRHGCTNKKCHFNLCETCLSKNKHEHPLAEYLIPKQQYKIEQLLSSIPHLLDPNNKENILTKTMWQNEIKSIGFYVSAQWCPPCRVFTPELVKIYKEVQEKSQGFNIIFLSCDQDENEFDSYRAEMPWPAVPLDSNDTLIEYFTPPGIPALIIVSSDGRILSRKGCDDVEQHGIEALETWAKGEKLSRPPADQYKWLHVACDVCGTKPIIGERYSCPTCENYDLCSSCQKKGHEHKLELQPLPNDDD